MTGIWVAADTITAARMNEKTVIQGSGATINGLTTYAGMCAYCTSSGSGFTADTFYVRNAANTAWIIHGRIFTPEVFTKTSAITGSPYIGERLIINTTKEFYNRDGYKALDGTLNVIDRFRGYPDVTRGDLAYPTSATSVIRINPTAFTIDSTSTSTAVLYRDLGAALSNTSWTVRFKIVVGTLTLGSSGGTYRLFVGMSNNTSDISVSQDLIAVAWTVTSTTKAIILTDTDAAVPRSVVDSTFTHAGAVETLYVEIVRLSTTSYKVTLYSEDTYTTVVESKTAASLASTTDTLRYFKVSTEVGSTGALTATITDLEIFDTITSGYPA